MPLAIAASVLGLVAVLIAYYRDAPLEERHPRTPDWDVLPDPAEVGRVEFPLTVPGYDPATVELHFELLARAYSDLLAVAPPDVVARARHRAALRRGVDPGSLPVMPAAAPPGPDQTALSPLAPESADVEALRAEAALADLDAGEAATASEPRD